MRPNLDQPVVAASIQLPKTENNMAIKKGMSDHHKAIAKGKN